MPKNSHRKVVTNFGLIFVVVNPRQVHSTWHTFPGTTPGIFLVYIFYIYAIVCTRKKPGAVPGKVCHVGPTGESGKKRA